ncbi:MAG TPA: MFS transporter [Thermoplasmata archaeon]|nr:MFS transporter [Thermoplasmata archaeon]
MDSRRTGAVATLVATRVVYAYNWYNVGAVLPLIGRSLHASTAALGVVLGAFLIGVSLFQLPAGLASARYGPRGVSLAGVALFGLAGVASAFSPNWQILAILRFVGGIGAAFFFAPALSLIASYFPGSERGPVIGLYNGGFSIGGALGLLGGATLGSVQGWAAALGYGGVALLGATAVTWVVVPPPGATAAPESKAGLRSMGSAVLRSRSIWALSLAIAGFWAAVFIIAQYFVDYAQAIHPDWGLAPVALLAASVVLIAFPGGPIGGWIAERGRDRRLLVGLAGLVTSLLVFAIPFASLAELWPIFLAAGFFDGMTFAILYLIPTYLPETSGEGLALGVGVVNSIQVLVGSVIAVIFGVIAGSFGYTDAWLFAGAVSVGLLPLLFFVQPNRGRSVLSNRSGADRAIPLE